jgi:hypothetical protein
MVTTSKVVTNIGARVSGSLSGSLSSSSPPLSKCPKAGETMSALSAMSARETSGSSTRKTGATAEKPASPAWNSGRIGAAKSAAGSPRRFASSACGAGASGEAWEINAAGA